MKYINFNNDKLPIGKRKQAYVKWVVSQGTDIIEAKRQANKSLDLKKSRNICYCNRLERSDRTKVFYWYSRNIFRVRFT